MLYNKGGPPANRPASPSPSRALAIRQETGIGAGRPTRDLGRKRGATPNDLDNLIGYHLRRASQLLMAALAEQLAELGLRVTEATVLVVLQSAPLSSQSDMGRILSIKRANMTPLVAGLIARGLVRRTTSSGRVHPLQLTRKGEDLATSARRAMADHDEFYFGALDEKQREWLTGLFSGIWSPASEPADGMTD